MKSGGLEFRHLRIDGGPVRLPAGIDIGDFGVGAGEGEPRLFDLGFLRLGVKPVSVIDAQDPGWNGIPRVGAGSEVCEDSGSNRDAGLITKASGIGGQDSMGARGWGSGVNTC